MIRVDNDAECRSGMPDKSYLTSYAAEKPVPFPIGSCRREGATEASSGLEAQYRSPRPEVPAVVLSPSTITDRHVVNDDYTQSCPTSESGVQNLGALHSQARSCSSSHWKTLSYERGRGRRQVIGS